MKFLLDNNLAPALARALDELSRPEGHQVLALRDKFIQTTEDAQWITVLSEEGGWAVVSQDHFNKKNGLEQEAIKRSGLTIFCLKKGWSSQPYWDKAHNLVRWFPRLVSQAEALTGGA